MLQSHHIVKFLVLCSGIKNCIWLIPIHPTSQFTLLDPYTAQHFQPSIEKRKWETHNLLLKYFNYKKWELVLVCSFKCSYLVTTARYLNLAALPSKQHQ